MLRQTIILFLIHANFPIHFFQLLIFIEAIPYWFKYNVVLLSFNVYDLNVIIVAVIIIIAHYF